MSFTQPAKLLSPAQPSPAQKLKNPRKTLASIFFHPTMAGGRFRELLKKYGKVALGVHCSVSAASITGLYVAIKNNVDVESLLEKLHMGSIGPSTKDQAPPEASSSSDGLLVENERPTSESPSTVLMEEKKRNRVAELTASTGGALALAVLCNKALFPIRVPITIAITPPMARFLARRGIIKNGA